MKSVYNQWEQAGHSRNLVMGAIWKNLSSPKVEIFTWMALQDRVASRSVLSRNLIQEGQDVVYPHCSLHSETACHLFLHCQFSLQVWSGILEWWHISWVCPRSLLNLWVWWVENSFKNWEKHLWETTFFATIWLIWLARNNLVFNGVVPKAKDIENLIKTRVAM